MTEKKKLVKKGDASRAPTVARPSNVSNARRASSLSGMAAGTHRPSRQTPAYPMQQGVRSAYPVQSVPSAGQSRQPVAQASGTLKRVVTVPQSTDNNAAWSTFEQRQRKLRKARSRSVKEQPVLVERTFRQTGMRATSGRIQSVRRPLPYRASVPDRSGRRHIRRRRLLSIVLLVLALAVVLALLYFFLLSTVFRVRTVDVSGTQSVALRNDVARMHIEGQNIFLLDMSRVKEQLSASPLVADVTVKKQWPATLAIAVVERQPALVWQSGQSAYLVDQSGMVIAPASTQSVTGSLNTVVDQSGQSSSTSGQKTEPQMRPGTYLKNVDIAFAVSVLQRLPAVTGINVAKLYYDGTMYASTTKGTGGGDSRGTYIIESPDGWKAYLGGAQDANSLDNRLQELREVLNLAKTQHEQIATIDLRYGLRPVFTLQK